MTAEELMLLKSGIDRPIRISTRDGEDLTVKVIWVFDQESDPDLFYELISTSRPELCVQREGIGGYSISLEDIASVKEVSER